MNITEIVGSTLESLREARILTGLYVSVSAQIQKTGLADYAESIEKANKLMSSRKNSDKHRGESELHLAEQKYNRFLVGSHPKALSTSLFIYQFSIFDAFFGRLLSEVYSRKPELVNSIEKSLTIKDISEFKSIKEIKSNLILKEIESLRRDSYIDQFKSMESKFGIKTLREYENWSIFIEAAQRRHLLTHCDGEVSQQYITILKSLGESPKYVVGDKVNIDAKYFNKVNDVISETCIKLTLILWRKFWSKEKEDQNKLFNNLMTSAIENGQYELAISLGVFSDTYKISEDLYRRMIKINLAQAYKWNDEIDKCNEILDEEDWSACTNEFNLCVSVLRDDFESASKLMIIIGKSSDIMDKSSYLTWPIFRRFTEEQAFKDAYKKIYRQDFMAAKTTAVKKEQKEANEASKRTK